MKILITGGAGYIGSVLTDLLLNDGYQVRVYDNLTFGVESLLPHFSNPHFEMVKGDIRDENALHHAIEGCDLIVHLAAIVGYPACDRDSILAKSVNVDGAGVLDSVRGSLPVIVASTGSVYGKVENLCSEATDPKPLTLYGKTKLEAEHILMDGGNAMVYRFATAFGLSPRLRLDLLVNDFTYKAVSDRYLIVYESHFRRTFLHVTDIARAIEHAIRYFNLMEGEVYNCGSNNLNATKKDIVDILAHHCSFNVHYADVGHDADQRDYEVDYSRLTNTGYKPCMPLETGIRDMVRAFQYLRVPNPYTNVGV